MHKTSTVTKSQARIAIHSQNDHSVSVSDVSTVAVKKSTHGSKDKIYGATQKADLLDVETDALDEIGPIRSTETRSFLNTSGSKVTGFRDVMERMQNADNGK